MSEQVRPHIASALLLDLRRSGMSVPWLLQRSWVSTSHLSGNQGLVIPESFSSLRQPSAHPHFHVPAHCKLIGRERLRTGYSHVHDQARATMQAESSMAFARGL